MFESLLIANRGEIAVRIIATAKRLGVRTVAVYSEADAGALHTRLADTALLIGPADAARSYLSAEAILAAAEASDADAIHPGYGFLSENAAFARACDAAGIVFVGPPADAIAAMGSKAAAKALMAQAGVPVVPGYHGERQGVEFLKARAEEIGYPVLIKAVAGGGGRGMRRADTPDTFAEALAAAQREAAALFQDERVLVERFIARPRHVEVQVFADAAGTTLSLHERDCTIQRRHQKVVEEAPAPGIDAATREAMGRAAVAAAEAVGYVGAGTVEFIAEADAATGVLSPDRFFFMEMNTRLQVEHPVTEAVLGLDLVEWQLRVAAGEPLPVREVDPPKGHAIEVRVYAEDPERAFMPSPGRVEALSWPPGVRVDAAVAEGDVIGAHYDPLIAKLIVHAADRDAARLQMVAALDATRLLGPRTNLSFLRAILTHPQFAGGLHDTGLIDRDPEALVGPSVSDGAIAAAIAILFAPQTEPQSSRDPFARADAFRLAHTARRTVGVMVDGTVAAVDVSETADGPFVVFGAERGGLGDPRVHVVRETAYAMENARSVAVRLVDELGRGRPDADGPATDAAPMSGRLVALFVTAGEVVRDGDRLYAIEAMKTEHLVRASAAGTVEAVRSSVGSQVSEGDIVVVIAPEPG